MAKNLKLGLFCSIAAISLASCKTATLSGRNDLATTIASNAGLQHSIIQAAPFSLTTFQRIGETGGDIHIYIEGDGLAWLSRTQPSMNPTPTDPFALKLAARDNSANVIYIARPCQYSGRIDGKPCEPKYWRGARYSPEVLQSYNAALDRIKSQYGAQNLHLIGYSGGGTMAAILAGQRSDIKTLRTVAGNLDHKEHSRHHNVSALSASLNPPEYADKLSSVPQYHFIGGHDDIVPQNIYQSYERYFQDKSCLNVRILDGQSHVSESWHSLWPSLLAQIPACK